MLTSKLTSPLLLGLATTVTTPSLAVNHVFVPFLRTRIVGGVLSSFPAVTETLSLINSSAVFP